MTTSPVYTAAEARESATFDALLWCLSHPGEIHDFPPRPAEAIVDALIDPECGVFSADPFLVPHIAATGADITDLPKADHVFLSDLTSLDLLDHIACGSDLYPDAGASVFVNATFQSGQNLRLSGPGVDGARMVQVGGLPDAFWRKRAAVIRYPMGFDLFLLDGASVMGLPRSTQIEVL